MDAQWIDDKFIKIDGALMIMTRLIAIISLVLIPISSASVVSTGDYDNDFSVTWSPNHVNTSVDGTTRHILLDQQSGAAFASNQMFLFGQVDMKIKLVPGNSAGTVVAFYFASDQPNRDEIDFEFLGNVIGQPYILQTNVYADGLDDREERMYLWFDPTVDFHTYSILWNQYQIVFMVDWVPIRVYRNDEDKGVAYPRRKPMGIKASIWDGSEWATRGGKDKADWSGAPFAASFGKYKIDACVWTGDGGQTCSASSGENWWNGDIHRNLTWPQRRLLKWARRYHLVYDYCHDYKRFNFSLPKECSLPIY